MEKIREYTLAEAVRGLGSKGHPVHPLYAVSNLEQTARMQLESKNPVENVNGRYLISQMDEMLNTPYDQKNLSEGVDHIMADKYDAEFVSGITTLLGFGGALCLSTNTGIPHSGLLGLSSLITGILGGKYIDKKIGDFGKNSKKGRALRSKLEKFCESMSKESIEEPYHAEEFTPEQWETKKEELYNAEKLN